MKKIIFLVLLLLASAGYSQSQFIEKNASGIIFSGDYLTLDNSSSLGTSGALSYKGRFDIGFIYSRASAENRDLKNNLLSPFLGIHFLRDRKISMAMNFYLISSKYSGKELEKYNSEMSSEGYSISGKLYGAFKGFSTIEIMPSIIYYYNDISTKYKGRFFNSIETIGDNSNIEVNISVLFNTTSNLKIALTPRFITDSNKMAYGITIGIIIPY